MQWSDRIGRRLKPRDLHVFIAVAEQGNMAKAAEQLAISRPVVSKTIADLEHTLGVRLLDRTSHGVEPTLYGRALLKRGVIVFDELRQSVQEIESLADPGSGVVRVACTEAIAAGLLSVAIDRLCRRHPRLAFDMQIGNAASQVDRLRQRTCDVIVGRPWQIAPDSDIESMPLYFDELKVVAGTSSRWSRRRKIVLADLVDERWIQARHEIEPGGPTYEAFQSAGLELPDVRIFSESLNLRYSLIRSGHFLTMLHSSVLRFAPSRVPLKVLPVTIPHWRIPMCISTLRQRTLSPATERFIAEVRQVAKPLANLPRS